MRTFHLFTHGGREKKYETHYPNEILIDSPEKLRKTISSDYVASRFLTRNRANKNFIETDCVLADIDNDTNDTEEWVTENDVTNALQDVEFYISPSRNHNREKINTETGEVKSPRPRFHLLFPVDPISDGDELKQVMAGIISRFPNVTDKGVKDPARFFYGVKDPKVVYHAGHKTIVEYLRDGGFLKDPAPAENDSEDSKPLPQMSQRDSEKWQREHIEELLNIIPADDYDEWIRIGLALKAAGFDVSTFDRWSSKSSKYVAAEIQKRWDGFHPNNIGFGHIVNRAKHYGWTKAKPAERKREETPKPETAADNNQPDLMQFHHTNAKGAITGVFDAAILNYLKSTEHIRIIGGTPYIYQNGVYIADKSGAMLKTKIRDLIFSEFVKAPTIKRIYDLFISDAALQAETEDMDKYPAHWICFRDGMYDPIKQEMHQHSPKYFALHQIPHNFPSNPKSSETVKNWLEFIAQPDDRKMLLQYAGYCMTRDTRQQKMLILSGEGGTGKSLVIRLIEDMVGSANRSNVSIEQFSNRFAAIQLFGKLLNSCADLKIKALEDVSLIKKAVGEDTLAGEAKGKDLISFKSCAKIAFSINQLPPVREEKTEGFYRRLLVLTMNRKPSEPDPDLYRKLSAELDAFMAMALDALHEMYAAGTITESEQSRKTVRDWRKKSDTVTAFLDDCTERDPAAIVKRSDFRRAYEQYCAANERVTHKKSVFNDILEEQHGIPRNTMLHGEYVVRGYKLLPIPIDL